MTEPSRLLLCASTVPEKGTLLSAVQPWVTVLEYDHAASLAELAVKLTWVSDRADRSSSNAVDSFQSAALLVSHGARDGAEGKLEITRGSTIDRCNVDAEDTASFFHELLELLSPSAQLDILGGTVGATPKGEALLAELSSRYKLQVSSSATFGAPSRSPDIEMERGSIAADSRLEAVYFQPALLRQWKGTLTKPSLVDALGNIKWPSLPLSPHPRCVRAAPWPARLLLLLMASCGIVVVASRIGLRDFGNKEADLQALCFVATALLAYLYCRYLLWLLWAAGIFVLAFVAVLWSTIKSCCLGACARLGLLGLRLT